ncbi:hypothetical protein CTAM01_07735 [Colletotrichum tamarilloi]|uniref:Uncharacterized protein n=1 Tax=Colletotrichum tamarilloi TaxID=1209934 RepID=A0ABQ9R8C7_9PEZI|nr:uncharacterized protein CTAM01_07735 [Colletotrichum tamarilloi]KAK1497465.1 hypothetical protein CTAM01_07735 [Colletotrichum tamarilloi]
MARCQLVSCSCVLPNHGLLATGRQDVAPLVDIIIIRSRAFMEAISANFSSVRSRAGADFLVDSFPASSLIRIPSIDKRRLRYKDDGAVIFVPRYCSSPIIFFESGPAILIKSHH